MHSPLWFNPPDSSIPAWLCFSVWYLWLYCLDLGIVYVQDLYLELCLPTSE